MRKNKKIYLLLSLVFMSLFALTNCSNNKKYSYFSLSTTNNISSNRTWSREIIYDNVDYTLNFGYKLSIIYFGISYDINNLNKYTTATIANVKPSIQSLLTKKIISNINFSVSYKINVTTNAYPTDAGLLNATTSSIINHVTLKQNKNNIYQLASTFNFDKRINGVSSYFKNNEKYKHNIDVIYKNSRFDLHFFTQPKFLDSIVISSINNDNKLISSTSVINNTSVQFEIIYFNGNVIVNDVVVNSKYNVSRSENFNFMNLYDKKTLDFILTPNSNSSSYEV